LAWASANAKQLAARKPVVTRFSAPGQRLVQQFHRGGGDGVTGASPVSFADFV
jgi:hypothetical protein